MHRILVFILLVILFVSCSGISKVLVIKQGQTMVVSKTIDLKGKDWVLPKNATLTCTSKGKIKNGRIVGQNSVIENLQVESVRFSGSFNVVSISLLNNMDSLFCDISKFGNLQILGNGHIVQSTSFGAIRNVNVEMRDVAFDRTNCKGPFLYPIGNGNNTFVIEDCRFDNIPEIELLKPRNMLNPVIRGCEFNGLLNTSCRSKATIVLNRFYECKGNISFENNTVKNCYGVAVNGIGYSKDDEITVSIRNNEISNVSNGGIVFNGGEVLNVCVENNAIFNTFCFGSQFDGERGVAENAAINFHGFHNLSIRNNTITDCIHSLALDLDGTSDDCSQKKGIRVICAGNTMRNVLHSCLFGVTDAEIYNNVLDIADQSSATSIISALSLNSCHNVEVRDNEFRLIKTNKTSAYPILIKQNTNRASGKINIHNNIIESDSNVYLMIYNGFTGEVEVENNKATSTKTSSPLKWVNNSKSKGIRVKDKNVYR